MSFEEYWESEGLQRLLSLNVEYGIDIKEEDIPVFELLAIRAWKAGQAATIKESRRSNPIRELL